MNPDDISPVALAVMLSLLPSTHVLVTAARAGLEAGRLREDAPLGLDDYAGGRFHRANTLTEYTKLQRHRWPPSGDRELWIRYGPAGPPAVEGVRAA